MSRFITSLVSIFGVSVGTGITDSVYDNINMKENKEIATCIESMVVTSVDISDMILPTPLSTAYRLGLCMAIAPSIYGYNLAYDYVKI
jgi:hypothetical protein